LKRISTLYICHPGHQRLALVASKPGKLRCQVDAAEKEIQQLRSFLRRCADHMICGSDIADTPLPTMEEWKEILK
jgi:hypothetical protein